MDATCAPADIRYPTDISLLNESRENCEAMIDYLYREFRDGLEKKPRDYRVVARKDFVAYVKKRKPRVKVRRKALKQQLNYVKRDIRLIDEMLSKIDSKDKGVVLIPFRMLNRFETIKVVYEQQYCMYTNKGNKVEDRIVSLSQPHIRPIVRGKAGQPTEFGAKISLSLSNGFSFVDRLSWDNYNESKDLASQIEMYKKRFGYYPESVHADKIYQTRENRDYCRKERYESLVSP